MEKGRSGGKETEERKEERRKRKERRRKRRIAEGARTDASTQECTCVLLGEK